MRHTGDHAARLRRVAQFGDPADLVEPKTDQGLALAVMPALRAPRLPHPDGLSRAVVHCRLLWLHSAEAGSASRSRRRACRAETLMLRRAATARGESWRLSASKVARTTL